MTQGGGAGYGDPLERDPSLVASDVRNGYASLERARADYGVVLSPGANEADVLATNRLRVERREAAKGTPTPT